MLLREATTQLASRAIDGTAIEDPAVRPREVDVLEDAPREWLCLEGHRRLHAGRADRDHFARLDLALVFRADDVQRARLGCKYNGAVQAAHYQRPPTARIASADECVADGDDETVCSFGALECFRDTQVRRRGRRFRQPMDD